MKIFELLNETKKIDISSIINKDIIFLNKIFKQGGFELRIVGGAVRDLINATN